MISGKVRLSNNPLLPGAQDFDFEILSVDNNPVPPNQLPPTSGNDAFDLHQAQIYSSPNDIADWLMTHLIKKIDMSPDNGIALTFDAPLPNSWKWPTGHGDDNFQYTVWAFCILNNRISGAAFIQMWQGRPSTGRMDPNLIWDGNEGHFHLNWAYSARWGDLNVYIPKSGDTMGFMVSAGNGRDQSGVTSVRERSNAVIITLPSNSQGSWSF